MLSIYCGVTAALGTATIAYVLPVAQARQHRENLGCIRQRSMPV